MQIRTYRTIHRWLGLIVGIQLLLWTAGGLFFSLNPIAKVRGETEAAEAPPVDPGAPGISPAAALIELLADRPDAVIRSVVLRSHLEGAVYEIAYQAEGEEHWVLSDAATGALLPPVSREEAIAIAQQASSIESPIADVTLVTKTESGSEYRKRPLPAYRITFDDSLGTRLYISVERGMVTARRNDRWRLFDLMWMLHIMDYQERDNFNTTLLQAASALGLVTILSGFVLAGITSPRLRRILGRSQPGAVE